MKWGVEVLSKKKKLNDRYREGEWQKIEEGIEGINGDRDVTWGVEHTIQCIDVVS